MDNLNILIDARMVTANVHGIGRYTCNLIGGLVKRGHKISILYHDQATPEIIGRKSLDAVIHCRAPFAHPGEILELSLKTREKNFDIVHLPSFAVPLVASKNTVVTIHDLIHLHTGSPLHHVYYKTIVKKALKECGAVIAVSEWTKKEIQDLLGIDPAKINVVRNGLEHGWFEEKKAGASPVSQPYFLCLSNPKPHKNVVTLAKACRELWDQGHQFCLALSLGGEEIPISWGIKENTILLKNLRDDELQNYFNHAAAVVSPAFFEGFDYPVAEALASGKTAVASTGSAHDEIQGSRLFSYKPADDFRSLAEVLTQVLTAPGDSSGSSHNIPNLDQMVDETVKIYEGVAKSATPFQAR